MTGGEPLDGGSGEAVAWMPVWSAVVLLRLVKILLAASVAAWASVGVLGNVLDWKGATSSVLSVTSMSTFPGGGASWRATSNPAVVAVGAGYIAMFKLAVAALCSAGALRMWRRRADDQASFTRAKALVLCGCTLAVLCLFTGWVVVGEGWFQFWRSAAMRDSAGETVFRYGGFIGLIALLIGAREE